MIRRALAAVLVALSASALLAADQKFTIAVLRRDGLMIPFASYDGRGWKVEWPGSANVPLPISLGDIPKAWWGPIGPTAAWTAWLPDQEKRPVKLLKPAHVPIFCGAHLAIATDYRGEGPAEHEPTVPKDAIVTAGDVTILPIVQVSVHAPDATRLVAAITEKFNEQETEVANKGFTSWSHPYGPAARAERPIELEAFYRASDTVGPVPYRTSYIEAVRRYPAMSGDEGCGLITFERGWVTEFSDGRKPIINLVPRITYCDRAEVSFMQPFGRVQLQGDGSRGRTPGTESYWIYQMSSWRDEFYRVSRVAADGVTPVVVVPGGGCPKEPER